MSNNCDCETCKNIAKYSDTTEKSAYVSRFKESIAQISSLSDDFSIDKPKDDDEDHTYRINVSEYCQHDGVFVEYSREITFSAFQMIMEELFSSDEDDFDLDNDEYEDDIRVFGSLDEVIDYLQQDRREKD